MRRSRPGVDRIPDIHVHAGPGRGMDRRRHSQHAEQRQTRSGFYLILHVDLVRGRVLVRQQLTFLILCC